MASQNELSRPELLSSLVGSSAVLPDMQTLLRDWPRSVNPEIDRLHKDVEKYLEMYTLPSIEWLPLTLCSSLFPPGRRLQKMKAANAALFGSLWWPYASFETLRIATYLSIWVSIQGRVLDESLADSIVAVCLG